MDKNIQRLSGLFRQMVANMQHLGCIWKNIQLGQEAFAIMKAFPDVWPGEFDTPAEKAALLEQMLEQMDETLSPRFCISVREEVERLDAGNEENAAHLCMLRDYIDSSLSMEDFCVKYSRSLKFDPIERTSEMEAMVVDVERECEALLAGYPRGMGFCFAYWAARAGVLAKRGIEWRSPAVMNPHVIFD